MPSSYTLGRHFESFIQSQLASGRYNNASEIVRDGLRLLEDRERRLAALDGALMKGIDDIQAGRVTPAETAFDDLERKYRRMDRDTASGQEARLMVCARSPMSRLSLNFRPGWNR